MSNSEFFKYPGELGLNFILSLFDYEGLSLDPALYSLLSITLAFVFWLLVVRVGIAIAKKLFGFDSRGRQH